MSVSHELYRGKEMCKFQIFNVTNII